MGYKNKALVRSSLLKKILSIYVILLMFSILFNICVSAPSTSRRTDTVFFYDDFNDNSLDTNKWTTYYTNNPNGFYKEANNSIEINLTEPAGGDQEGIESSNFSVILSPNNPVNITWDVNTSKTGTNSTVGQIVFDITDGTNWIEARYKRDVDDTTYQDSTDSSYTILHSESDGSWSNRIQLFSDRYRIKMNNTESANISYNLFSSNATLRVKLLIELGGSTPGDVFIAGFDNVYVNGTQPQIEFKPQTPADKTVDIGVNVNDTNYNSSFIDWDNSLVGYWNFEHTNDAQVNDSSTYNNNAAFVNMYPSNITNGKYGNGMYFNGSNQAYLNCGNNPSLNITNEITVELDFKENETTFNKSFGNSTSSYDLGCCAKQTNDGGYVIVGAVDVDTPTDPESGKGSAVIIKTDSNGRKEWINYSGASLGGYYCFNYVNQISDGGYIVTGEKWNGTSPSNKDDLWLIKFDSNGTLKWENTWGSTGNDVGYCVQQTSDEGYIITGKEWNVTYSHYDLWLINTTSTGSKSWDKTYNSSGNTGDDVGYSVLETNGGYVVTGYNSSGNDKNFWVFKTNQDGNKISGHEYIDKSTGNDFGREIQPTNDGGYIVAGTTQSHSNSQSDALLLKLNNDFSSNTTKYYDESSSGDYGYSCQQTMDGGYILTGTCNASGDESYGSLFLVKTDSNLNQEWNRTFDTPSPYNIGRSVRQTSDGGYIIAGRINETNTDYRDILLAKTDIYGNITGDKNNQTLNKTLVGKGRDAYQLELYNGTISGYINGTPCVSTNQDLNDLSQYWHHVALTYDGSNIKLYVNGTLEAFYPCNGIINVSSNDLTIGNNFTGIIDEVRVWNRSLSWEEINASYNCSGSYDHTFTGLSDGSYSYYAYAIDSEGNENWTENRTITVNTYIPPPPTPPTPNKAPTADAGGPYSGYVNSTITFDGSKSSDSDGIIAGYRWDFNNDGTYDTDWSTSNTTTHSYSSAGTYTVKLQVKDNGGLTDTNTTTVTISETPLVDNPPTISDLKNTPPKVTSSDNVTISAIVTDDYGITSVTLYWNDGLDHDKSMNNTGDMYYFNIGHFLEGTTVTYRVEATDTKQQTKIETGTFTVVAPPITIPLENVSQGNETEVGVGSGAINSIKFKPSTNLENVNITIENLTADEVPLMYNGTGIVYRYLNMTITANDTYVTEFESLIINFTVNKIWFEEQNNISSIELWRYHNNTWQNRTTNRTGNNETDYYYEAESPGLSTFAVVGSRVLEKSEAQNQEPNVPWPIIIGSIIVGIVILIFVLFKAKLIYVEDVEVVVTEKKEEEKKDK